MCYIIKAYNGPIMIISGTFLNWTGGNKIPESHCTSSSNFKQIYFLKCVFLLKAIAGGIWLVYLELCFDENTPAVTHNTTNINSDQ